MAVTDPVSLDLRAKARAAALKHGVDPDLYVRQIEQESRFDPKAVSPAGAIGIAQLMPDTARELGVDPNDPEASLDAGARYMRQHLDRFGGDYRKALAAYNAGAGRVAQAGGVPAIPETRDYVRKIVGSRPIAELGAAVKRKHPGAYDQYDDAEVGRRFKAKWQAKDPRAYADFDDTPTDSTARAPAPPTTDTAVQRLPVMAVQETDRRRQIAAQRAFPEQSPEIAESRLKQFESLHPAVQATLRVGAGAGGVFPGTEEQGRQRHEFVPQPQNTVERLTEGLGGAAMFGLESALLAPLGPAAAAGIPAILQPGTTPQRYVRGVTMGAAGIGAEALAPAVAKLGGGATAQAVTRTAAGPAAFGVAAPWVEAASYHLLGDPNARWPTAREMAENVGLLFGLGLATHAATARLAPEKQAGFAAIKQSIAEPAMAEGTAPAEAAKLRRASKIATDEFNRQMKGTQLSFLRGDETITGDVAYGAVYPYPGEPAQVRVILHDPKSGAMVPFAFRDLEALRSAVAGDRPARPKTQAPARKPKPARVAAPERAPEPVAGKPAEVAGGQAPKGGGPEATSGEPAAPARPLPEYITESRGRWFTTDPNKAKAFGERQLAVDVPAEWKPDRGANEHVIPESFLKLVRPVGELGEVPAGFKRLYRGEPATTGTRGYKTGERLLVPYRGRSKTRISEGGIFEGYVEKEGVAHVVVRVSKGKSSETRTEPETMVRRRPKIDRRPVAARKPGMTALLRKQGKGDPAVAGANYIRLRDAFDQFESEAKQLDFGSEKYVAARRKLPGMLDRVEAALSVAHEAGWKPEPPPEIDYAAGMGDFSAFGVGTIQKVAEHVIARYKASVRRRAAERIDAVARKADYETKVHASAERILDIIKQAEPLRKRQEEIVSEEKSVRRGHAMQVSTKAGEKGFYAELGRMKGEYSKVEWEARQKMAQEDVDALFVAIREHPDLQYFETFGAREGLRKLLDKGEVPTDSELALLEKVFGPKFVDRVMKNRELLIRLKKLGYEVINVPRAYMASFDISAPFRQGLFLTAAYPRHFLPAMREMFKSLASERWFHESHQEIASRPDYQLMKDSRLALTEVGRVTTQREEAFMGALLAERRGPVGAGIGAMAGASVGFTVGGPVGAAIGAPVGALLGPRGVRASNRAYSGYLNRLRADAFDSLMREWRASRADELAAAAESSVGARSALKKILAYSGQRPSKAEVEALTHALGPKFIAELKSGPRTIADFVNTASGRGDGRFLRDHIEGLNAAFYSPRFIASRIKLLNPGTYLLAPPAVRKAQWRGLRVLGGVGLTTLGLAAAAGLDVGTDPKKSTYGKIRVGNTYFDIWGGIQQYIVFATRMAAWALGDKTIDAWDTFERFAWGKTSPVINFAIGAMKRENLKGDKFHLLPSKKSEGEIMERFVPMAIHDAWDVYRESPELTFVAAPAAALGLGVQTFDRSGRRPTRRRRERE